MRQLKITRYMCRIHVAYMFLTLLLDESAMSLYPNILLRVRNTMALSWNPQFGRNVANKFIVCSTIGLSNISLQKQIQRASGSYKIIIKSYIYFETFLTTTSKFHFNFKRFHLRSLGNLTPSMVTSMTLLKAFPSESTTGDKDKHFLVIMFKTQHLDGLTGRHYYW